MVILAETNKGREGKKKERFVESKVQIFKYGFFFPLVNKQNYLIVKYYFINEYYLKQGIVVINQSRPLFFEF